MNSSVDIFQEIFRELLGFWIAIFLSFLKSTVASSDHPAINENIYKTLIWQQQLHMNVCSKFDFDQVANGKALQ